MYDRQLPHNRKKKQSTWPWRSTELGAFSWSRRCFWHHGFIIKSLF
jgi:hypothetical protein